MIFASKSELRLLWSCKFNVFVGGEDGGGGQGQRAGRMNRSVHPRN